MKSFIHDLFHDTIEFPAWLVAILALVGVIDFIEWVVSKV